ncbi:MAG TPA: PLP-dependent aspartate aminotransferase family protein [Planctomycetia bacterium]|nr:PLP-dependent aspartate aminotransferase family protein [Planctomycetia bacterium]
MTEPNHAFRTRAIHVGNEKDPATGAVVAPIHLASTYVQPGAGEWGRFDYSRTANPTRSALETTISSLEGGTGTLCYASGMAATHGAMMLLEAGDHVLAGKEIYGGTYRLLHKILPRQGITFSHVATDNLEEVAAAFQPNTKMLWMESPGNPLLTISDIAACAKIAREKGALLAVDNTLASPVITRPLELGADVVMHSATKYFGGHSDLLGGALVTKDASLHKKLHSFLNATGGVMGPLEAFLCQRGLKTLELRVKEQSRTALALAEFLAAHPKVARVNYPGLAKHPGHDLAKRQMSGGFGCILSFEVKGDYEASRRFVNATKLFQLAVSLGAVESLIAQPASMSHAAYDRAERLALGVTDGLVRLSVGLEDLTDLEADLEAAFEQV